MKWRQLHRRLSVQRAIKLLLFALLMRILYSYLPTSKRSQRKRYERLLDSVCSPVTNSCFLITDAEARDGRVFRQIFIKEIREEVESQFLLIRPENADLIEDTESWAVDATWLPAEYLKWMLAAVFITDTVAFSHLDTVRPMHFLFIGLGGGSLPSYIHLKMPQINITVVELDPSVKEMATKWFHFKEDPKLRVEIADGVNYLCNSARHKNSYDAIFLDACDGDHRARISCPVHPFLEDSTITCALQSLKPMGVLTVNVLVHQEELVETIAKKFRQIFPTVIVQYMPGESNSVLLCLPYALADFQDTKMIYKDRFERLKEQLNLDIEYPATA